MEMKAVLFGSIGTLAETSELQRRAYNLAFATFDLDWVWERRIYDRMLTNPGGEARILAYGQDAGDEVDAKALHVKKQQIFQILLSTSDVMARAGVPEVLDACRDNGISTAFCTTTSQFQVHALLDALSPRVSAASFDWIGDASAVERAKPSPDIYETALRRLGVDAGEAVAIEDSPECAEAALAAGVRVVGFAGAAFANRAFPSGAQVISRLTFADLARPRALAAE